MSNRLVNSITPWVKGHVSAARSILWCVLLSTIVLPASQTLAFPGIRFQWTTVRATIPVNSTTNATFTAAVTNNSVVLVDGVTNAIFDIAGLPAGVTAALQDSNGIPVTSITGSSNIWLVLNAANVAEGTYTFTLDASGTDTNGNPATNFFPFVLQSAHIWYGNGPGASSFTKSNNWASAASWLGGVPAATDDVVIADLGSQTNLFGNGLTYSNIGITANTTISSLRFAQSTHSDVTQTNAEYHNLFISNNVILSVTGAVGFSLLRDYVDEFGYSPDSTMGVMFSGNGGSLMVSNANANFGVLVPSSQQPSLVLSNLGTFVASVSRFGASDYQLYPNYVTMNGGYNGGRDTNQYAGIPRRFWSTVFLARTNIIQATYADPDNYTNEATRSYALSLQNNDQSGNGSAVNTFFMLGVTNAFFVDSVCFIGANSASGNTGGTKFWATRVANTAIFRGTNGGRMSVFTTSDDGGPNEASSNVKSTTDFSGPTNRVDILADRFYIARDRTLITSNQTPNVQGDVTIGYGNVDVNTAVLGYQEHSNKIDWPTLSGGAAPAYLNYCQGRLVLTNGGTGFPSTFKVNGNLTLGFTADMNPVGSAQQYNTYGRITIYSNATLIASNIICDGGLNYYDSFGRQNTISLNQGGTLVVSNTLGFPNLGASDFSASDPHGMPLDSLQIAGGSTLTLQVNPSITNVFVRQLTTPGIIPGIIKVAKLTGVTSYPIEIPVISYQGSATPFLNADVSALGAGFFAYVLNNAPNQTVDLFITTNAPNNLLWTGSAGPTWDTNSFNWVPIGGGAATNFHTGDLVTFNDSSAVNNVIISDEVVPGQTGAGVIISNTMEQYTFSGGQVAGTALVVKQGTNSLEFDATEQGPINITAGTVIGSGSIGNSTVWSNAVLNYSGSINGGLTSTGAVFIASGATENGPVSIQGGSLDNVGTINTTINQLMAFANCAVTNESSGMINVGTGPGNATTVDLTSGAVLANFGTINLFQPRIQVEGLLFGNGLIVDPNGGGLESVNNGNAARVLINQGGTMGVGPTPSGTIGQVSLECRFDFNNDPTATPAGISTILLDFDPINQTNDVINCDRWNNDTGLLLFTNIHGGPIQFNNGQVITIFNNSSGSGTNNHVDTTGFAPLIEPYVPGPGLVWNVTNYNTFGTITVTNIGQIWDGTATGNWSTNNPADTCWKTGRTYTDFGGAYFDDSASGTTVVNLTSTNSPAGIRGTNAAGQGGILDSNQPTFLPGMIISNATKNYVFTGPGKISGVTGIYKTGPGTATLLTTNANDFSGNVIIDNGTLAVSNAPGNGSIVSLGTAGGGQMKNDLILDGGTLSYLGLTNVTLNQSPSLFSHNGTFAVMSPTNMFTIGKTISGVGSLTKAGPGTLALGSTANIYSGGTIVGAGTLRLTGGGVPGLASASVTFLNGTSLEITNSINLSNALDIAGGPVGFRILGVATNVFFGPWTGAGPVTFSNNNVGPATFAFSGDLSGYSGSISLGSSSGSYVFNNATNKNPCTGSALASFDLGTGSSTLSNFNGAGLTYNLGSLAGGANTILAGRMSNSPAPLGTTYSIGANGNSTTFSGKIADGLDSVAVVKVGSGSLLLNGANTFSGGTIVSNGTLGGTGSIASALTVTSGGTLAPGAPTGTFTVNNSATLGGTALMELNVASSPLNSALTVTGTLTGGGALVVTNVGPNIANGTRFQLFNKPVTGFASVTLPATDPSHTSTYSWQTNLATDGSIMLITGGISVNTTPTNLTVSASGNSITLTWPGDHLGWELQSNPVSLTASNMWFPVAGSTSVTQQNATIDLTKTNVFFRMVYPPQ